MLGFSAGFARSRFAALLIAAVGSSVAFLAAHSIALTAYLDHSSRLHSHPGHLASLCALQPSNPECALRLAVRAEETGNSAIDYWQNAIRLNPINSQSLIQAALAFELAGSRSATEDALLAAASSSNTWLPRWSLANFYHRAGNRRLTLYWASLALQRPYGDLSPLFQLCIDAGASPKEILRDILPPDAAAPLRGYVSFLMKHGSAANLFDAASTLETLASRGTSLESLDLLTSSCDRLIELSEPALAHTLWTRMISHSTLGPAFAAPPSRSPGAAALADPSFAASLPTPAFGWRIAREQGVDILPAAAPGTLKIFLSGQQPERAVLLSQVVRLSPGIKWAILCELNAATPEAFSHFRWTLTPLDATSAIPPSTELRPAFSSGSWSLASTAWALPDDAEFYRLRFEYVRPVGSARLAGELRIRSPRLHPERSR